MAKKTKKTIKKRKSTGVNPDIPPAEVTITKADNGLVVSSFDKKWNKKVSVAKDINEAMTIAEKKLGK